MIYNQVAEKYAQALFDLAKEEGGLEEYLSQLEFVDELVKSNKEFNHLLNSPNLSSHSKKELLITLFKGKIAKNLMDLMGLLIDKGREGLLSSIYSVYKSLLGEELNRLEVEVISPSKLSSKDKGMLKKRLEELTGKDIILSLNLNEELLGGLILKIGNKVIDGTILNSLKRLEDNLKCIEVSKLGVKNNES